MAHSTPTKPTNDPLDSTTSDSDTSKPPTITSTPLSQDVGPPPDGGLTAWAQVFMGHLVLINSWGYLTSYGLFQSHYATTLSIPPSSLSWIGSLQTFLIYFIGAFSGRALDAGYYHHVLIAGSLLQIVGCFATSVSSQYWHLFLAQGLCQGLGDGLTFCPTVSLVATYFSPSKRAFPMAITASGAAIGGIIFPVIAQQLLPRIGFGWTVRVMGFVLVFNTVVIVCLARVRLPPRRTGPLVEWAAFREAPFSLFCVGMFLSLWAVYFAYFYISAFGKDVVRVTPSMSFTILVVMNAVGFPGRIICGLTSDRFFGPIATLTPVCFLSGVLLFGWIGVREVGPLFVFCVVYGFFASGVQSLFPAACASLTRDHQKMGVRTGMCFTVVSLACLTGPPIAGALIEKAEGDFLYAQLFGGVSFMLGSGTLLAAGWAKRKMDAEVKEM
ncbi:MFS general substrate transporter [Ascobolus immersus RN42]|uniref:MFS general substrate transporter n=1 Tax=Ascobolus immersus RN42 TaxID=1160509 RepID=A0A3N4IFJ0_ASCIM|nr:MFS general substrate transporter [Ascobolus immersus RN42]